jgi:hypothetical protein
VLHIDRLLAGGAVLLEPGSRKRARELVEHGRRAVLLAIVVQPSRGDHGGVVDRGHLYCQCGATAQGISGSGRDQTGNASPARATGSIRNLPFRRPVISGQEPT